MAWFVENIGTILVSLFLMVLVAWSVASIVRNKKKGRSSCGCGCVSCPMSSSCQGKD